jgi:hypothetical protein
MSDMMIERGRPFDHGEIVDLGGKFPVLVFDANEDALRDYTIQATEFFQTSDYTVQQVVAPDTNGRFPYDPLCLPDYKVPLLKAHAVN